METKQDQFPMRLQVFLAHCGIASRRACEALILEGRVQVNGKPVVELGTKVSKNDVVCFDGKPVSLEEKKVYVLLNKPKGYLCASRDDFGRPLAKDLLAKAYQQRLFNGGRVGFSLSVGEKSSPPSRPVRMPPMQSMFPN